MCLSRYEIKFHFFGHLLICPKSCSWFTYGVNLLHQSVQLFLYRLRLLLYSRPFFPIRTSFLLRFSLFFYRKSIFMVLLAGLGWYISSFFSFTNSLTFHCSFVQLVENGFRLMVYGCTNANVLCEPRHNAKVFSPFTRTALIEMLPRRRRKTQKEIRFVSYAHSLSLTHAVIA